jgi:hypothetical protein
MDVVDRRAGRGRFRVYVCPRDYLLFAQPEKVRWEPVIDTTEHEPVTAQDALPLLPVRGPEDLIATLSGRGMIGWALLVKDVAEGRVRRLHLRQLPADPAIRQALVTYLQSAGAEITLSHDLLPESLGKAPSSGGTSPE